MIKIDDVLIFNLETDLELARVSSVAACAGALEAGHAVAAGAPVLARRRLALIIFQLASFPSIS